MQVELTQARQFLGLPRCYDRVARRLDSPAGGDPTLGARRKRVKNLVPIGRFSKVCRLTIKALRHYDEIGLLRPAVVDADSGYRYYSLSQAMEAERIRLLRTLDMPLEEIRAVLAENDSDALRERLARHQQTIEQRVVEYQRAIAFLRKLTQAQEDIMSYCIQVRSLEAQSVVSVRTKTSLAALGQTMGQAFGQLFGYLGQLGEKPAGPPFAIYHDPEFKEQDMDIEVCLPVGRPLAGNAFIQGKQFPACEAAATLHSGPYDQIGPAYQSLMKWIQDQGREPSGPPREVYLVGPDPSRDPSEYRTEVVWPIAG